MTRYTIDLTMIATYSYEIETDHEQGTDDFNDAVDDGWVAVPYADMETSDITIDRITRLAAEQTERSAA